MSKQSPRPSGVYAALATPRRAGSTEADAAALLDYLDAVVRAGVDGLVLFGSTGEFVHFDIGERTRVLALAIRRSRVPVLVNVSHSTLEGALELAESAMYSEAAGVLVMPPYFYRYTPDQVRTFYESFLDAIGGKTPVYLYNIPFFTNPIPADVAVGLLLSSRVAGIKDSSGDWSIFEMLRSARAKQEFALLCGNESIYLHARMAGADGIVSGVAAAIPELPVAMERAMAANDEERAERLNARLLEFIAWIEKFPATICIKQAAVARGWNFNHFAFPMDDETLSQLAAFRAWARDWIPVVLAECAEPPIAVRVKSAR